MKYGVDVNARKVHRKHLYEFIVLLLFYFCIRKSIIGIVKQFFNVNISKQK